MGWAVMTVSLAIAINRLQHNRWKWTGYASPTLALLGIISAFAGPRMQFGWGVAFGWQSWLSALLATPHVCMLLLRVFLARRTLAFNRAD